MSSSLLVDSSMFANLADFVTLSNPNWEWIKNVRWMNERAKPNCAYKPVHVEQIANIVTHAVCIAPSAWASLTLVHRAANWPQYTSALIYGAALISLFLVSTVFHFVYYFSHYSNLRDVLHRGDRAMIYMFIAASYYPWLTLLPSADLMEQLQWLIWIFAFMGILYQQLFHEKYKCLETMFYVIIGVMPSVIIITTLNDFHGLTELKIGGLIYMAGVVFFKSDGKIPFAHAIWHLFVAMAAAIHYFAILKYLFPMESVIKIP